MKSKEHIVSPTHFEFLNKLLLVNLKGWMKVTYPINDLDIWFIKLDGRESSMGWTNTLVSENLIIEEYTGDPEKRIPPHKDPNFNKKRAIFDIENIGGSRRYIFRGVFVFSFADGNNDKRVWERISDSYEF